MTLQTQGQPVLGWVGRKRTYGAGLDNVKTVSQSITTDHGGDLMYESTGFPCVGGARAQLAQLRPHAGVFGDVNIRRHVTSMRQDECLGVVMWPACTLVNGEMEQYELYRVMSLVKRQQSGLVKVPSPRARGGALMPRVVGPRPRWSFALHS